MITDAQIWLDLYARLSAIRTLTEREVDGTDAATCIADTAEALGVDEDRVRQVYAERTICGIGG